MEVVKNGGSMQFTSQKKKILLNFFAIFSFISPCFASKRKQPSRTAPKPTTYKPQPRQTTKPKPRTPTKQPKATEEQSIFERAEPREEKPITPEKILPEKIEQPSKEPESFGETAVSEPDIFGETPKEKKPAKPAVPPSKKPSEEPDIFGESGAPSSGEPDIFGETPAEEVPKEKKEEAEAEPGIEMDLPIIGKVKLIPFTEKDDMGKEISGMKVYLPASKKIINWGPLVINKGELRYIGEKPQYLAYGKLFGEPIRLGIKDFALGSESKDKKTFTRVRFGIDFTDKKPTIELIPGKRAELQAVDLELEKTKPIQLIAVSNILSQKADIVFSIEKDATDAWLELKNVPLTDLISQANGTPLEKAILKSIKMTVKNFSSRLKKPRELTIEGLADLSNTPGLEQSNEVKNINLKITATEIKQTLLATAASLNIPGFGLVKDAKIEANFTKEKKDVTLQGNSSIDFPGIGTFDTKLVSTINNDGIDFSASIQQTVSFAGIDVKNAMLKFSTAKKTIAIAGLGKIKGFVADVEIVKDLQDMVSARASLKEKEFTPFKDLEIPVVKDLTLKDPGFRFIRTAKEFEAIMEGIVTVFDVPLKGDLYLKKTESGKTISLLEVAAPKNWKLSQGIKEFDGTFFDKIELEELYFIFSSDEYKDEERQTTFKPGFNFISKTTLSGDLAPVATLTKTDPTSKITLQGYIPPNPIESKFKASIPNGIVLKQNNVTLGKLELEIGGVPTPMFSLLTTMIIIPDPNDLDASGKPRELTFTTRIGFNTLTQQAIFAGTMEGAWKNPLGIKGFAIGIDEADVPVRGVAADVTINLLTFPEKPIPDSIGLAGGFMINPDKKITMTDDKGNKIEVPLYVAMAIKLPIVGPGDLILYGELSELTLEDLAAAAKSAIGNPLNVGKMPDIGIRTAKIYLVTPEPPATTAKIGELTFNKGFTLRGEVFIPGIKAYGTFSIGGDGIVAQALCSKIEYGPLLITRSKAETEEMKKKKESIDPKLKDYDGAVASLKLTLLDQSIYISGLMKLANIFEQDALISMDRDGLEFDIHTVLGKSTYKDPKTGKDLPLLDAEIKGKSSGSLEHPQFALAVDLEQHFQQYLLSEIKEGIKNAKIKVNEDIGKAIYSIQASRALDPETVGKKVDEAQQEVMDKRKKVEQLQKDIDALQRKINQCV